MFPTIAFTLQTPALNHPEGTILPYQVIVPPGGGQSPINWRIVMT